jgi:TATA-binding protein-associated factor Taf7
VNFSVLQANSDSIQEGNQNIRIYFKDKEKRRRQQLLLNSKLATIIMGITKQRRNEASSENPSIEQDYLDNVQKYFCGYYVIINLEPFIST